MRDALKSFYFCLKKADARRGIFILFYQIVMETLFYERIQVKNLYNHNFVDL